MYEYDNEGVTLNFWKRKIIAWFVINIFFYYYSVDAEE